MKNFFVIIVLCLFISLQAFAGLHVVTTTTELAAIATEMGGVHAEVKSLIKGSQDPHYIEPKPSYASILNKADLFIAMGLSLEIGWVPSLLTQSRNAKIQRGHEGFIEPYQGIRILEIPSGVVDRSGGDIHPEGNPHYLMDPRNGVIVAKNIAQKMAELDPAHGDSYQKNYEIFAETMNHKIGEWQRVLSKHRGLKVVTHHQTFSYFADWLGVRVLDRIENKPGIPPSPGHMVDLIKLIKKESVPLVLLENYYDPKPSQKLAGETGVKVLTLPVSVNGVETVTTYAGLFDYIVTQIVGAQ
ncbi:MAG: zinc ABC transporter substrate-binding protein [Deltaproteobacteria bacterium]|nr:zinc ABC transporter substrate-binding protein [Deltaproteobacteria bacterium]